MDVRDYEVDKSMSTKARRVLAYVVLVLLAVLCLFWFYMLFIYATLKHSDISLGFRAYPGTNFLENFHNVFVDGTFPIFNGLLNSFIIATLTALGSVYFSTMTAYAIHVYDFKLKKFFFTAILMIMMIPTQVTVLGFIDWMKTLHIIGHENYVDYIALIVPAFAAPVTFYYMKQYMESTLPLALVEAARIDGSGEWRTFNSIALPLMKPAISVQAIFAFVSSWNNLFVPSRILTGGSPRLKTVPLIISLLRSADYASFDLGKVYFTIFVAVFPVIVVYLILSRYIVGGVAVGAVKG